MMDNIEYLIGAYALIWLVLAYYFYVSGAKLKQIEEKVKMLEDEKNR
ncbi:CcmD family protein [uncultured Brachyspira sp.]|nr:CcmD family protein [uncultured Brachyspira sp.]